MLLPARHLHRTAFGAVQVSNLLHSQEIASSGKKRPPRNDTPFLKNTPGEYNLPLSIPPFPL